MVIVAVVAFAAAAAGIGVARVVRRADDRRRAPLPADRPQPRRGRRPRRRATSSPTRDYRAVPRDRPAPADRADWPTAALIEPARPAAARASWPSRWRSAAGSAAKLDARPCVAAALAALIAVDRGAPLRGAGRAPRLAVVALLRGSRRRWRPTARRSTRSCRPRWRHGRGRRPHRAAAPRRPGRARRSLRRRPAVAVGEVRAGGRRRSRAVGALAARARRGVAGAGARAGRRRSPPPAWPSWSAHQAVYGGRDRRTPPGRTSSAASSTVVGSDPDYVGRSAAPGRACSSTATSAWRPGSRRGCCSCPRSPRSLAPPAARRGGRSLLPLAAGWLVATFVALTMQGWWFPGRQVVVVLPAAVLAIAWWARGGGSRLAAPSRSARSASSPRPASSRRGRSAASPGSSTSRSTADPLYRAWTAVLPDYLVEDAATWPLHWAWTALLVAGPPRSPCGASAPGPARRPSGGRPVPAPPRPPSSPAAPGSSVRTSPNGSSPTGSA